MQRLLPDGTVPAEEVARTEKLWLAAMLALLGVMMAVVVAASAINAIHAPSNVETINPVTLHLGGEFAESNLGTAQEWNGSLAVRVIATQYAFVPDCVKVAVDTPVKFRLTSTDVIHGFLLPSTNVNTMVVVALPTLLTVFAICASLEIAGRYRGGRGLLGWITALPWDEPIVLATGLSLVMLGLGGGGGLINMSYDMNSMIHNTAWVPAHFHLIFGGAVLIMYFAIAYEMWPRITGKPLRSKRLARWQLWLWFIGMMVTTIPWHITGLMGQPRRVAMFDFSDPLLAPMVPFAVMSVVGGFILLVSAILLVTVLVRSQFGDAVLQAPLRYALAVNPPVRVPGALNGFALWNVILLMFMVVEYGYPIGQFFFLKSSVPTYEMTRQSTIPGTR